MTFRPDHDLCGTIARLFIHPIKSCAGIEVREALLTDTGLAWDRAWMVVDSAGVFITQRELPRMALIIPQLKSDEMVLRALGMLALHLKLDVVKTPVTVQIWKDTVPAWDMGDLAAQWFSDFLGLPCRLVRFDTKHRRLSSRSWTGGMEALNQFADGFPILVTSRASIDDLNERLEAAGYEGVGVERFRPNVVIDGVEAHDEDRIDTLYIGADEGEVHLQHVKPCTRCSIPNIDPATAQSALQVGDILASYRQDRRLDGAITFGMNAIVCEGVGRILRVGQPIAADLQFD